MTLPHTSPDAPAASPGAAPAEAAGPAPAVQPPAVPIRRYRRRLVWILALAGIVSVAGVLVWYFGFRGPSDDLGRFQGDWKLTIGGRKAAEGDDERPQLAVRITGDRWQNYAGGEARRAFRMTLHEDASPKEIELTLLDDAGNPLGKYWSHGIYAIEENVARVLVVPENKPRPTDLNDPNANVWVLSRVKLQLPDPRRK